MNKIYIPENYKPVLDAYDTQRAIAYIKETFQQEFSKALNLKRVSAPLFVTESSGLNDNLNGYERPVAFDIPAVGMDFSCPEVRGLSLLKERKCLCTLRRVI